MHRNQNESILANIVILDTNIKISNGTHLQLINLNLSIIKNLNSLVQNSIFNISNSSILIEVFYKKYFF